MSRHLKIAAAQLGPPNRSDTRAAATQRLVNLLREAHAMGAKFVVFPELAFTTFFPRWWMEDQAEVDARFFEKSIPSKETQPLFDEAKKLGIGFYIGYAELTPDNHRYNAAILVSPDGRIVGKYRKVHLPGHAETAKCGYDDGFRMFGHSLIVAPTGEIAVKSQTEEDEVICTNADIDMAANLKRTMFNFAAHRRPEHYRLIVERVGAEVAPAKEGT